MTTMMRALALASSSAVVACGGTVVFEEPGGAGGSGATQSSSVGPTGGPTTGGSTSGGPSTTVGQSGSVGTATSSSGGGPGICGSGVSLFGGSQDTCVGNACCELFQQCALQGSDPAGCDLCIDQGGGPRCADALRCVSESGCFDGADVCANGLVTGDPSIDECLSSACCVEGLACTQGGDDPGGCFECLQQGGGPRCNGLLQCADASGCFFAEGICDTGITTQDPGTDACLTRNCCDEFRSCVGGDVEACLECFNEGGGPLCDAAIDCAERNCGFVLPD